MVLPYNHVLMALPATEDDLAPLGKEIFSFLWTPTVEPVRKGQLVAFKRLSASFEKGRLQNTASPGSGPWTTA
jgi:hypothetical protein